MNLQTLSSGILSQGGFKPAYKTALGSAYCADSLKILEAMPDDSINLVVTSPPFALLRKKEYGNESQDEYINWLAQFARLVFSKLKSDGSFVIDLGGAYRQGIPSRSLYNFRVLIKFCDEIGFHLAEDFYWFNPSKLPSPIEWVNKRKIRVKDSINTVWWLSKTEWPKADVKKVLAPYSDRMKKLLENPESFYSAKKRPSGHDISKRFSVDNGGSIPPNLLQIPHSESNGCYLSACQLVGVKQHPARFPHRLPEFFIKFLTEPGDLVVDIFAGSNTTGMVCEDMARNWLAIDMDASYIAASAFRFMDQELLGKEKLTSLHKKILDGESVDLTQINETNSRLPL